MCGYTHIYVCYIHGYISHMCCVASASSSGTQNPRKSATPRATPAPPQVQAPPAQLPRYLAASSPEPLVPAPLAGGVRKEIVSRMATTAQAASSTAALQVAPASPVCLDGTSPPRPVSASSKLNLGSLLRLFKSEFFGAWLAVSYLYKVSTTCQRHLAFSPSSPRLTLVPCSVSKPRRPSLSQQRAVQPPRGPDRILPARAVQLAHHATGRPPGTRAIHPGPMRHVPALCLQGRMAAAGVRRGRQPGLQEEVPGPARGMRDSRGEPQAARAAPAA
jgi:hypothetical protein